VEELSRLPQVVRVICFYCCERVDDEHVCQELAESRRDASLLHDSDTVLYWKAKVRQMSQEDKTKGS
jgi:hypothetical protein